MAYLHFDIQNTCPVLLRNILDSLNAGAIVVGTELGMLNEAACIDKFQKILLGNKVVLDTILLASSRCTSGVRDGEAVAIREFLQQAVKMSGLAGARGSGYDDWTGCLCYKEVSMQLLGINCTWSGSTD